MSRLVMLFASVVTVACVHHPAPPREDPVQDDDGHSLPREYLLRIPHEPSGREPVSPAFRRAMEEYEAGLTEYRAHRFESAAAAFMRAAEAQRLPKDVAYLDVASRNREVYLYDAACAWMMVGAAARARAELTRLKEDGRISRVEYRRVLAGIDEVSR